MTQLIIGIIVTLLIGLWITISIIKDWLNSAGTSILIGAIWVFFYMVLYGLFWSNFYPKTEVIKPEIVTTQNFKLVIYDGTEKKYSEKSDYDRVDSTTTFYLIKRYNMYGGMEQKEILYLK